MTLGTIVYLCWYDFQKQTEHVCKGEVVDNSLWAGTKQADMVNVRFQAPGMTASICHHFTADRLSMTDSDVPHDECYLVCGKKTRAYQHDATVKQKPQQASDAWLQVQQFKRDRWDYKLGHLDIDALDEFYQLWRDAIAAKLGVLQNETPSAVASAPVTLPSHKETTIPAASPAGKRKRSTGSVTYKDSIQTSLFD